MLFFPACNLREHLDRLNLDIKGKFLKSIPQINSLCFPPLRQHISLENRQTLPMLVSLQQILTHNGILQQSEISWGKKKKILFMMGGQRLLKPAQVPKPESYKDLLSHP